MTRYNDAMRKLLATVVICVFADPAFAQAPPRAGADAPSQWLAPTSKQPPQITPSIKPQLQRPTDLEPSVKVKTLRIDPNGTIVK